MFHQIDCIFVTHILIILFGTIPKGRGVYPDDTYITTLVSPNFPDEYPPNSKKNWALEIPDGEQAIIRIRDYDLEETWDTLSVGYRSTDNSSYVDIWLRTGNVTSLILPSGTISIHFCSDEMQQFRGFAMDIHSYALNVSTNFSRPGSVGEFVCSSGLQLILFLARCDGVIDCHDYSDEMGCGGCKSDEFHCGESDICLAPRFQCDDVVDCPEGDDEKNCDTLKCPAGCSCGEGLPEDYRYGPFSPSCNQAFLKPWLPFWTNGTSDWKEEFGRQGPRKTTLM